MDYVGIDHLIGLSCRSCKNTTVMPYSWLLDAVLGDRPIVCDYCGRTMSHGWDSIEAAQMLVDKDMRKRREQVA